MFNIIYTRDWHRRSESDSPTPALIVLLMGVRERYYVQLLVYARNKQFTVLYLPTDNGHFPFQ